MSGRKPKYTGGPWKVWSKSRGTVAAAKDDGHIIIAVHSSVNESLSRSERAANATLIAASKELFELGRVAMQSTCELCHCQQGNIGCMPDCDAVPFRRLLERLESEVTEVTE